MVDVLIPKALFTGKYKQLSSEARIMYGLMICEYGIDILNSDGFSLAIKMHQEKFAEMMNLSVQMIRKIVTQLENAGLVLRHDVIRTEMLLFPADIEKDGADT